MYGRQWGLEELPVPTAESPFAPQLSPPAPDLRENHNACHQVLLDVRRSTRRFPSGEMDPLQREGKAEGKTLLAAAPHANGLCDSLEATP